MDNFALKHQHANVYYVDFERREQEQEASPVELTTPLQAYELIGADDQTAAINEYDHLVDPDRLPFLDDPDTALLIEGMLSTLEIGELCVGDQTIPINPTHLGFRGRVYTVISENLPDRTCAYFKGKDWRELLGHLQDYSQKREAYN